MTESNPPAAPGHIADDIQAAAETFRRDYQAIFTQVASVIVGHETVVHGALTCLFAGGHALLEGAPGLGKTALVRTIAQSTSLQFGRIQFTPDLMPADITGTDVLSNDPTGQPRITFRPGPIFGQIILADEINRATPKTQSALLEAMQEHQVTAGGQILPLPAPFLVMATQNPIEQEGTYPLPEAQLDRFFHKLLLDNPTQMQLHEILDRTTATSAQPLVSILTASQVQAHQKTVRRILIAHHVQDYAVRCVLATHADSPLATDLVRRYVHLGASPRGAQAIILAAKVHALIAGRFHVSFDDIKQAILPALRHRLILNYHADADAINADKILSQVIEQTPTSESSQNR